MSRQACVAALLLMCAGVAAAQPEAGPQACPDLSAMDKTIEDRDGVFSWLVWLNHDSAWTSRRRDPRFKAIQQGAGWSSAP